MKGLFSAAISVCLLSVLLLSGCAKGGSQQLSASDLKAFDSAAPDMKQMWSTALEASKTNDYVGGQLLFGKLLAMELSPAQRDAVSKESTALNQRLYDAFSKGDPAAQKAMQELRANRR